MRRCEIKLPPNSISAIQSLDKPAHTKHHAEDRAKGTYVAPMFYHEYFNDYFNQRLTFLYTSIFLSVSGSAAKI